MERELELSLIEFIVTRCATALHESEDYTKLQSDDCTKEELLDSALILGYKKGALDMLNLMNYLQPQITAK